METASTCQTLRSVSDNHLFVICRDGEFYDLPDDVHHRGPWAALDRRAGPVVSLTVSGWVAEQVIRTH